MPTGLRVWLVAHSVPLQPPAPPSQGEAAPEWNLQEAADGDPEASGNDPSAAWEGRVQTLKGHVTEEVGYS